MMTGWPIFMTVLCLSRKVYKIEGQGTDSITICGNITYMTSNIHYIIVNPQLTTVAVLQQLHERPVYTLISMNFQKSFGQD